MKTRYNNDAYQISDQEFVGGDPEYGDRNVVREVGRALIGLSFLQPLINQLRSSEQRTVSFQITNSTTLICILDPDSFAQTESGSRAKINTQQKQRRQK